MVKKTSTKKFYKAKIKKPEDLYIRLARHGVQHDFGWTYEYRWATSYAEAYTKFQRAFRGREIMELTESIYEPRKKKKG